MTIIVLTDCPPRLRGDLTKWLQEINTGVYVGHLNPRVRDALWERVCEHVKSGRATMVYRANNEQRMKFCVHNTTWEPVDFDGLTLMRRPLPQRREASADAAAILPEGFSNAAHQQKARQMMKRKPTQNAYIVIDVETTGLRPAEEEIIEVAALRVVDGQPAAEFSQLVRIDRPLTPEIVRLTGITDAALQAEGRPLRDVLRDLQTFVGQLPIVSHNVSFDRQFLTAACRKAGSPVFKNRMIDTLSLARRKLRNVPNYKLSTLAAHLNLRATHPHRALNDCHTTHQLYAKLNET